MSNSQYPSNFFLRFAITPYCNFKCYYCNPESKLENSKTLSDNDILQIMKAGFHAGINRIHWTGGEPTIKDMERLISESRQIGYIDQVLTTNGSCGGDYVRKMSAAGLNRLIVSLDTLNPIRFKEITKKDCLDDVIETIKTSVEVLEEPTKINVVYLEETRKELPQLIGLSQEINANPNNKGSLIVKLIEMTEMNPVFYTESGRNLYKKHHIGRDIMKRELEELGSLEPVSIIGNNPNTHYFYMPEFGITIGMITIPSQDYICGGEGCAKIRLNPYGMIAVCVNQEPIAIKGKSENEQSEIMRKLMEYRKSLNSIIPQRRHKQQDNFGYWRFGNCRDMQTKNTINI